ncbi:uncharacterized protein JCM6883_000075 [Sporobolomyces salmoneus]|uniref:uncharacterized protein n=1 Tax=Sporobolomyces salmoneus TaxID=183962 RepID=UPI00317C47EF
MQFLSRFSKSKDSKTHRRHSTPPPASQSTSSYLPLSLPSSSLLRDESLAIPLGRTTAEDTNEDSRSVDTTPWLEIANEGVGNSPRILSNKTLEPEAAGGGGRLRRNLEDPVKVKKEMIKLEQTRLEIEQMTTLMEECGEVIRSRGLTTLGIFRPFRLPESLPRIRQLCLFFDDYNSEFDLKIPATATRGTRASKTVKLHRFKEELRYAEIHDVVAVLKWGLRHFSPSSSFALSSTSTFDFYRTFLKSTSAASHPRDSFTRFLLPLLPTTSRSLLISTLKLIQAVSSYSEVNAMTCRKLCRTIGYYLFRHDHKNDQEEGWEQLYSRWKESGEVVEGLVKAYLWEQKDLPPRLQELVVDYPKYVERAKTGSGDGGIGARNVRVLKVELESRGEGWKRVGEEDGKVNDQETGRLVGGEGTTSQFARRRPVDILLDALEGEVEQGEEGDALADWKVVREKGSDRGGARDVLDEEVVRVLDLLGLSESSTPTTTSDDRAVSPRRRVTSGPLSSLSEESSQANGISPTYSNFPNKSVSHLLPPTTRDQKRIVTPSWNDFAQTGFLNGSTELNVSDEFGRFDSSTSSVASPVKRPPKREKTKILKVELITDVEEEFADFWLDTLVESTTTSSPVSAWPSIVIAPLHSTLSASMPLVSSSSTDRLYLLLTDKLLPLSNPPSTLLAAPPLQRNLSRNSSKKGRSDETSSLNPRKWTKRASSIFGVAATREISPSDQTSPPTTTNALPRTKKSRRSMFVPNLPPPVPLLPRRASADPASATSTSPSTSPSNEGNVITRTLSRTLPRRKSKTSISSPKSPEEGDRQLASPPKFEAELLEPVPAIPEKYSLEVEEAKRRSQTSPLEVEKPLPELEQQPSTTDKGIDRDAPKKEEEQEVKVSAVPLVPESTQQILSPPETPLREVLLQGQPILSAAIESSPPPTDNIPLADSPTISRAAAIRTPSSEAPSFVLSSAIATQPDHLAPVTSEEEEQLKTPEISNGPPDSATSPMFTLSPPEGEPEVMAPSIEGEGESAQDQVEIQEPSIPEDTSHMGLGLSNVGQPVFESTPTPVEPESTPLLPQEREPSATPPAPTSPPTLAAPTSPSLDPSSKSSSPTVPSSPTPSGTSQGSSSSKKFLARTRSFLSRKKSSTTLDKDKAKEKAQADLLKRETSLRRTQPPRDESEASPMTKKEKERQAPTPVSSVKKRVAELEAAANREASVTPTQTTTGSRIRKASSPTPASPTSRDSPSPLPPQTGSAASSIIPLPEVEDVQEEGTVDRQLSAPELEPQSTPEVIEEIHEEERDTEIGPPTNLDKDEPVEKPIAIPSVVVEETLAQEENSSALEEPSSNPQAESVESANPPLSADLVDSDRLVKEEEERINSSETLGDIPAQEANHLSVKVPSSLEDLPSPLPSPSPAPLSDSEPVAQLTESESTPQIQAPPGEFEKEEIPSLQHERQNTEATITLPSHEGNELESIVPQTPLKNSTTNDPSSLVTPSAALFTSSSSPSKQPTVATNDESDPFIDSTPIKQPPPPSLTPSPVSVPSESSASSPSQLHRQVTSQSYRSVSTKDSMETFETAGNGGGTESLNSGSSSLHGNEA